MFSLQLMLFTYDTNKYSVNLKTETTKVFTDFYLQCAEIEAALRLFI